MCAVAFLYFAHLSPVRVGHLGLPTRAVGCLGWPEEWVSVLMTLVWVRTRHL